MENTAVFVKAPQKIDDLLSAYTGEQCQRFIIEKTIILPKIDFVNFAEDLCMDRWFIEENRFLCRIDDNGVWHCIHAKTEKLSTGILIMSRNAAHPEYAAYCPSV